MDDVLSEVLQGKVCPYCNCQTELVTDKDIYGPNANYGGYFYRCTKNHDHYVGCYPNSTKSLGRVADKELRELKHNGHEMFDPLWRDSPKVFPNRPAAYQWLSHQMGLPRDLTHFGMFDKVQCRQALEIIQKFKETL